MEIPVPSLLRIKPKAFHKIGKYLRSLGWTKVAVVWGDGLQTRLGERLQISLDATDVRVDWTQTIRDNAVETLFPLSLTLPGSVQALVAVGGGKAIDAAKYLSLLTQKPLLAVPTAVSNDGFCSPFSSLLVAGARRTMRTALPEAVVLDTEILASCPQALLYSGVGDLFCKFTSVFDWKLAFKKTGEAVNDFAAVTARNAADTFLHFSPKVWENLDYLRILSSSLLMTGLSMVMAGSSRPASGSEHLISHAYDQIAPQPSLHGLQVGVASYAAAWLQKDTFAAVERCALESGFWDHVAQNPLDKKAFLAAIPRAPLVKERFYTILNEPGAVERLLEYCDTDPRMQLVLQ